MPVPYFERVYFFHEGKKMIIKEFMLDSLEMQCIANADLNTNWNKFFEGKEGLKENLLFKLEEKFKFLNSVVCDFDDSDRKTLYHSKLFNKKLITFNLIKVHTNDSIMKFYVKNKYTINSFVFIGFWYYFTYCYCSNKPLYLTSNIILTNILRCALFNV